MVAAGFKIGEVSIDPPLILAPMSGVTDSPFRRAVRAASGRSVGLLVSEFIKIELLTARNLRSTVRMAFHADERPVSIQIYGTDIPMMVEAAKMIEATGADIVDINCGCPAPKIVRRGGGAGLLRDLPHLGRIVEAVEREVSIPVTVKIRNGWCEESLNAHEALHVVQESGAKALAVHGRTRMQLYRGDADWNIIKELSEVARIPIIGSGDVMETSDATGRFDQTSCAGIMIGRGAIKNPWIFAQIHAEMQGRPAAVPKWREVIELLRSYRTMLDAQYPERVAPGRLKMMLSRLMKQFPDDGSTRTQCLRQQTPDQIIGALEAACHERGLLELPTNTPNSAVSVAS